MTAHRSDVRDFEQGIVEDSLFHAEAPVVDPKAELAKPADKKKTPQKDDAQPVAPAASTDAMLAIERTGKPGEHTTEKNWRT